MRIKETILKHIKGNIIIYFLVIMFLVIGISAGAFTVKAMSDHQKQDLISYLRSFFQILSQRNFEEISVLKQSIANNLQTGILIWILGITIVGAPLILLLIGLRGFIIGFTVGFLVEQMGFKGLLFAILSILPQNIFIIPALISIAVIAISFSMMIIKNKINRNYHWDTFRQFIMYSTIIAMIFFVILLGCVIEAYITPVFMRLVSQYM